MESRLVFNFVVISWYGCLQHDARPQGIQAANSLCLKLDHGLEPYGTWGGGVVTSDTCPLLLDLCRV
ncbi:hypothetical protein T440DRAFT_186865 [Plenodomus tracheiphilus IPT5]|uniref:Uncharacterized protein n=1 Tax=Plenodomus tracheiphilus IPT5 TaxID=1408161 RepID=A0A6A7AZZ0_9PLEO|nr:hypothetical protein T440DRAFT_186865 [Plenodomus tracheiphilus IPT5]